jgi:hypothetical protein
LPAQDPIGQHVRMGPDIGRVDRPWATIVGVVGNVKQESLAIMHQDAFYITTAQWAWGDDMQSVVVRTRGIARRACAFHSAGHLVRGQGPAHRPR